MQFMMLQWISVFACISSCLAADIQNKLSGHTKLEEVKYWKGCNTILGNTKCPDGSCAGMYDRCSAGLPIPGGVPCNPIYEKKCPGGECISQLRMCPGYKCIVLLQRSCKDGSCILSTRDCADECAYKSCGWGSGRCYDMDTECDGWADCVLTKQDELDCSNKIEVPKLPNEDHFTFDSSHISWDWVAFVIPAVIAFFIIVTICACKTSKAQARNAVPVPGPIRTTGLTLPPYRGHHNPMATDSPQNVDAYDAAMPASMVEAARGDGYIRITNSLSGTTNEDSMDYATPPAADNSSSENVDAAPPPSYSEAVGMGGPLPKKTQIHEKSVLAPCDDLPSYETALNCDYK